METMSGATTTVGGHGQWSHLNELSTPYSISTDEQRTIYVADYYHHRAIAWKHEAKGEEIITGSQKASDRLMLPVVILIDRKAKGSITSECKHRRVV